MTPFVSLPPSRPAAGRRGAMACVAALMAGLASAPVLAQGYPPPSVGVIVVEPQQVSIASELPGRISPTRIAEVRPRVNGIIERRVFEQGSEVEAGDVLFEIDRSSYEVAVEAARATVARAEAGLADAQLTEGRYASLRERNVSSQADYDSARTAVLQARAALAEAEAQLRAAEINLGYTEVRAPISGRTGRALTTEGALVAAQGEVLTTIRQLDQVYADMQQPVSELLRLRRALESGELTEVAPGVAEVRVYLDDGSLYPHAGQLLFSEASVERTSGQVTLRAEIPNPEGTLLPGMYVRVWVQQAVQDDAIVIPEQAIRRDASGKAQVMLVTSEGTVAARPVVTGRATGRQVTLEDGLAPGDMVIVDGFQKTGPGAPVTPVCWTDPAGDAMATDPIAEGDTASETGSEAQNAAPDACAMAVDALQPQTAN